MDDNIAFYTRNLDKGITENVLQAIPELYNKGSRTVDTKKGQWFVTTRKDFPVPYLIPPEQPTHQDGFCAVYAANGRVRTLIIGDTLSNPVIDNTLGEITDNVLEQGKFTWPPRNLTTETEGRYVSLPLRGGAIAAMLSPIIEGSATVPNFYLANTMLITAVMTTITLPFVQLFGPGRRADKKRVEHLPAEALDFRYGVRAEMNIIGEYCALQIERIKRRLFDEAAERTGIEISPEMFLLHYEAAKDKPEEEALDEIIEKCTRVEELTLFPPNSS